MPVPKPSIRLTLEQRKMILQLMNYSYTIPAEYQKCVGDAIKRHATKPLTDDTVRRMVEKSQSIANSGFLLHQDNMSLFRGKFAEWLACIEYNAMKNSGAVIMTIVNPDETSKADLLHFIKVGNEFKAVPGPDIKSGGSTYVFNQWKKVVTNRYDIPMVDFDGILTTDDGLRQLTTKERLQFEELCQKFPHKHPIPSMWSKQDELRLRMDYFKDILGEETFEYSPEVLNTLKEQLRERATDTQPQSDWSEFNRKCKEIFKDFGEIEKLEHPSSDSPKMHSPTATYSIKTPGLFDSEKNTPKENLADDGAWGDQDTFQEIDPEVLDIGEDEDTNFSLWEPAVKWFESAPWWMKVGVIGLGAGTLVAAVHSVIKQTGGSLFDTLDINDIVEGVPQANADSVLTSILGDSLDSARKSPTLHTVVGYIRRSGVRVKGYQRGFTQ